LQYLSIALVVVAVVFQNAILQRILGPDQGAAESRLPLNQLALNIIADHPIIGVGANNYATVMVDYLGPEFTGEWIFTVHNRYLLIWAEAGFLGLLSWLAFLGLTIYYGYQCWRLNDRFYSILGLGAVAGILAHMLHMTYDIFNARTLFQPLLTNAAFITAIALVGAQQLRARKANAALPSLPTETLPTNDPTTNRHVRPSSWSVR
jgi:O-antigen ligase